MYNMVESMLDRGVPIDGVGLQMHVGTGYDLVDGVKANMERYGGEALTSMLLPLFLNSNSSMLLAMLVARRRSRPRGPHH